MRDVAYLVDHGWEAVDETKHVEIGDARRD
jgi:hypothetical protein